MIGRRRASGTFQPGSLRLDRLGGFGPPRKRGHALLLFVVLALSCDDGPAAPKHASLAVTPSSVTLASLGETAAFSASITDQHGAAFAGRVEWRTSRPAVFTVTTGGVVEAVGNGSGTLTASFRGLTATASVTVAQVPTALNVASGGEQAAPQGRALPEPVVVSVLDAEGAPVPGARVAFAPATGHGTVEPSAAASDSAGLAATTWTLGDTIGPHVLTATVGDGVSVQIAATALAPAVPESISVSPSSVAFTHLADTATFTAAIVDQYGGAYPETASWSGSAPSVFVIDADGVATAVGNGQGTVTASFQGLTATASVTVEQVPAEVRAWSGTDQRARAGRTLSELVRVRAEDAGGSPVAGVTVTFVPGQGHGTVEPATAASDSAGLAATMWTLGETVGPQVLTATVGDGVSAQIAATALAPEQTVAAVEVAGGTNQLGPVGHALRHPVVVRLLDAAGAPVEGATVKFAPATGHGTVEPATAASDSAGLASTTWTLGDAIGAQVLTVTVGDSVSAQIAATALAGPDLAVSVAPDSVTVAPGGRFRFMVTIRNQGDADAAATHVWTFVSADTIVTTSDDETGEPADVPALAAGKSAEGAVTVSMSGSALPGTVLYLGQCVDAVPGESEIGNNCSNAMTIVVRTAGGDAASAAGRFRSAGPDSVAARALRIDRSRLVIIVHRKEGGQ